MVNSLEISKILQSYDFKAFLEKDINYYKKIFADKKLHRFNKMYEYFYLAIEKIHYDYKDYAANIWNDNPKSATLIRRFLEFKGVGIKIASMAANTLVRDFKIKLQDYRYIDISPDVQVRRVFIRLGFIPNYASNEVLVYRAREFYPEYPGVFDFPLWEIGRDYCRPTNPKCNYCFLNIYCPKII